MIKLKEFLTLIKPGYRIDLYVDDVASLSCGIEDAIKIFKYDKRGELNVNAGSVSFYEQSSGSAGLYRKYVVVHCYSTNTNEYSEIYDELSDIRVTIKLIDSQKSLSTFRNVVGDEQVRDKLLKLQNRLSIIKDKSLKFEDSKLANEIGDIINKLTDANNLQYEAKIEAFNVVAYQLDNKLYSLLCYCNSKFDNSNERKD